jgi:hypothetical protein
MNEQRASRTGNGSPAAKSNAIQDGMVGGKGRLFTIERAKYHGAPQFVQPESWQTPAVRIICSHSLGVQSVAGQVFRNNPRFRHLCSRGLADSRQRKYRSSAARTSASPKSCAKPPSLWMFKKKWAYGCGGKDGVSGYAQAYKIVV